MDDGICGVLDVLVRGVVPEGDSEVLCFGPFGENGSDFVVFLACNVDFVYNNMRGCLNSLVWQVLGEAECINLLVLERRLSSAWVDIFQVEGGDGVGRRDQEFMASVGTECSDDGEVEEVTFLIYICAVFNG